MVLDGMGLILQGSGATDERAGILVNGTSENVQVTNFTIANWVYGVLYDGVTYNATNTNGGGELAVTPVGNEISDVTVTDTTYGIYVKNSENVTVKDNTANNNAVFGIILDSSHNSTLTDNFANENGNGIGFYWSHNNTLAGNFANNNTGYGIYVVSSNNNTLTGNDANNNKHGITLDLSHNNTLAGNYAIDNNEQGFFLLESRRNTLLNNCAMENRIAVLS